MTIKTSRLPLQRLMQTLPRPLRRIRVAQGLAVLAGSPYHRVAFQSGSLIGNVRDSAVAHSLVCGRAEDYGYLRLAGRLLKAGDRHVDLGANYGFHTFGLLDLPIADSLKFFLIDANPDCIACLSESAKLHSKARIKVLHCAASLTSGTIKFTFDPATTGSGHVGAANSAGAVEVIVPAAPLDELFEEQQIERIGLLKMDIEGSETFAARSLSRMLSSHRINYIYFEVNPEFLRLQQSDPMALFQEFTRHGYRLFWPHDEVDWIVKTYGPENVRVSDLRRFTIPGEQPHRVIEFDSSCYRAGQFGQCDLLAISPACQVEATAYAE